MAVHFVSPKLHALEFCCNKLRTIWEKLCSLETQCVSPVFNAPYEKSETTIENVNFHGWELPGSEIKERMMHATGKHKYRCKDKKRINPGYK